MKVVYNITQNKFNATLNQETTEIKVKFQTGYYPLPVGLENYYLKSETYSQNEVDNSLVAKLDKGNYTGTAQDLKNSIDGKASISHTHDISSITNLQTSLNNKLDKGTYTGTAQDLKNDIETKQKKLSSFDESILIETDGNIEGNVSLFTEYFQQQVCELNFTPIQIIGVYKNGIKLLPEEFNITLPKTTTIKTYSTEKIEIQYIHLKNN